MSRPPRVLLAVADEPTLVGLRLVLSRSGFEVVGEVREARDALDAAIGERPDLCLLGADLPGDGINAVRGIRAALGSAKIVVLSRHPSGPELLAAVSAGAVGYLGTDMSLERLPLALTGVLSGEVALPRRYTSCVLEALRSRDTRRSRVGARANESPTDREWEVLQLLAADASTAEMAYRLGISAVTVRRHVSSLIRKLGVPNRAAAAQLLATATVD